MAGYFVNTDKVELSTRAYALNRGATVSTVFGMEQCGSVYIVKDWLITGEVSLKHSYWSTESAVCEMAAVSKAYNLDSRQSFRDTEQFIEDQGVIINDHYWAQITCEIESKGFRKQPIDSFFSRFTWLRRYIPRGPKLYFELRTDAPSYDAIWWKVRNVGAEAERRNDIRGQIEKQWGKSKTETSKFVGPHYVEAYVIKGHECIAMAHYNVPIGNSDV